MRNVLLIIIVLVFLTNTAFSKEAPFFRAKEGDQALIFTIIGLENLKAGDFGGGLGYQYYFANHLAFRFGLGGKYSIETQEKPETGLQDLKTTKSRLEFRPAIRYNFGASSNVLAYCGGEAIFMMINNHTDGISFISNTKTERLSAFGAGFFVGAEWFAWNNVAISAEYKLDAIYSFGSIETNNNGVKSKINIPSLLDIGLGASAINFSISFYFN